MACPFLGTQVWGTVQFHILVKPRAVQLVLSTRAAFLSSVNTLQGTTAPSRECSGVWGLEAALDRRDSSTEGNGVAGGEGSRGRHAVMVVVGVRASCRLCRMVVITVQPETAR